MDKRVIPLALGGLGIGTTEFVIMGMLPDVARDLSISIPEAGHLISAYALGVVVGAPLLVATTAKLQPKRILIALMVAFTVFNTLSAIAPDHWTLLLARFFSGLPHGAFFGVGAVVATRLAPPGKQAHYIALMFTGLTVANLAMVPLVTWIGQSCGWRWAFGIVGALGLVTLVSVHLWLPAMQRLGSGSLKDELQVFRTWKAWHVLLITAIGFGGLFAWFSYITPLMTDVAGFAPEHISYFMVLTGAGMVVGNLAGGVMADRLSPARAGAILLFAMTAALLAVFSFAHIPWIAAVLMLICGALSMAVGSPVNVLMLRSAPNSQMMAAAFMQAAFNVANSVGAYFGGVPLERGLPYTYPSLVGAAMAFAGLLLCLLFLRKYGTGVPAPVAVPLH